MQSTFQSAERRRVPDPYDSRRQWDDVVEWRRAQTAEMTRGGGMRDEVRGEREAEVRRCEKSLLGVARVTTSRLPT